MKNKSNTINVILWDKLVGKLYVDEREISHFQYDKDFVSLGINIAPITMPLKSNIVYSFPNLETETFQGLPGLISDSLPDAFGNRIINKHLASVNTSEGSPTIQKLAYLSKKGSGALEYSPPI